MSHPFIRYCCLIICRFHIIKDERLVSKMEGKLIFFEAPETVRWLELTDPDPHILRQIYTPVGLYAFCNLRILHVRVAYGLYLFRRHVCCRCCTPTAACTRSPHRRSFRRLDRCMVDRRSETGRRRRDVAA